MVFSNGHFHVLRLWMIEFEIGNKQKTEKIKWKQKLFCLFSLIQWFSWCQQIAIWINAITAIKSRLWRFTSRAHTRDDTSNWFNQIYPDAEVELCKACPNGPRRIRWYRSTWVDVELNDEPFPLGITPIWFQKDEIIVRLKEAKIPTTICGQVRFSISAIHQTHHRNKYKEPRSFQQPNFTEHLCRLL